MLERKILEKDVEAALVKRVKSLGGIAYKFVSPSNRSVPDRICLLPNGNIIFAELKRPGAKPTENQLRNHEKIRNLGYAVMVIDSLEQVEVFPKEIP